LRIQPEQHSLIGFKKKMYLTFAWDALHPDVTLWTGLVQGEALRPLLINDFEYFDHTGHVVIGSGKLSWLRSSSAVFGRYKESKTKLFTCAPGATPVIPDTPANALVGSLKD
jgi:hypothetical protein